MTVHSAWVACRTPICCRQEGEASGQGLDKQTQRQRLRGGNSKEEPQVARKDCFVCGQYFCLLSTGWDNKSQGRCTRKEPALGDSADAAGDTRSKGAKSTSLELLTARSADPRIPCTRHLRGSVFYLVTPIKPGHKAVCHRKSTKSLFE